MNGRSARFTAVTGDIVYLLSKRIEIVSLPAAGFKTFGAIVVSQFVGGDGQMAMPAPNPLFLCRQQGELGVFTGVHVHVRIDVPKLKIMPISYLVPIRNLPFPDGHYLQNHPSIAYMVR
jgi:hypothetical protein